jgi:tRNA threonylcarbamoyl adenosine modification protein YeaZ
MIRLRLVASKQLIPTLSQLLHDHHIQLQQLPFLAINQGPGPFTTLRVVITTANGLSFASGIPLIGIDALTAAHIEWHNNKYPFTVIMFNAFAFDVYCLIEQNSNVIFTGYKNIDQLLQELSKHRESIRFIGNGVALYREKIKNIFGNYAYIPEPNPRYCSLEQIGKMGYAAWKQGNKGVQQLLPLYLKQHPVMQ